MDVEARLRAFAAVARAGSFSRAAERLYVSQPAVSKHVASLEAELGMQLVVRGRPHATLTPAGQVLADYVLRAEALLANARRALAAGADAHIGTLALAASGVPGTYLLPALLARFHERHAGVEIDFRVATSGGALELVRAHEVELAVVGGMTVPPELESEPLIEDEVVLIGPPELGGRRLRLRDLQGTTWISREEGSATRAAVEAARWQVGLAAVRQFELPSWEAVKLAVANGAGIAAISRFALGVELEAGTLAVLDVPRWRLSRTISVVRAADVPLTPPAERFLGMLREQFRAAEDALPPNSNLPAQATPLVGREAELVDISAALAASRLVTLTGPGGSGKTRLAIAAAAREVDRFTDGVLFVDLTPIREAGRVLDAVADTLGAPALAERLRGQSMLLVLDNFEQVVEAAPAVAELLDASPALSVLVTSRVRLRVRGERVVEVPPLAGDEAVALFMQVGSSMRPDLEPDEVVAGICDRLDGLPLAVELAAARCNVLSPPQLLARIENGLEVLASPRRDSEARRQTLRATIAWSCDLLGSEARTLFGCLAVFVGGCSLDAAEAVCLGTLDTLAELVEHNLVRRDGDRFVMLDTIHRYAEELLAAYGDEDELRRRHAEYFAALAEEAAPHLRGRDQTEWFRRLREEAENVRAAVAWANGAGKRELQLRIAGAPWQYWIGQSGRDEWGGWLEQALAEVDEPRLRLLALRPLSWLALGAGDHDRAEGLAQERLELGRQFEMPHDIAGGYSVLSLIAEARGNLEQARRLAEAAVALDRESDDDSLVPHLSNLAGLLLRLGDADGARALFEESRDLARKRGDEFLACSVQCDIAAVELREGNAAEALALMVESLPGVLAGADAHSTWLALELFGAALVEVGRWADGAALLAAAEEIRASTGEGRIADGAALRDRVLVRAADCLGEEAFAAACANGLGLDANRAVELALAAADR